jgi:hypothetical protein
MRALEQDVTKRQSSAKEFKRALPEPKPENRSGQLGGSAGLAIATGAGSPMSTQSTVVLGSSNAPAAAPSRPMTPWKSAMSSKPPASTMQTIVLSEAVAERNKSGNITTGGRTAAEIVGPQIKRAIELTGKARSMIERRLKARKASSASSAAPSASSTAKTKELKPAAAASAYGSRLASTGDSAQADTQSRTGSRSSSPRKYSPPILTGSGSDGLFGNNNGADVSLAPAKLVSRGDEIEFGIFGMRTVIGRSQDGADQLDIDLKKLVHGGDRVSRRHAEIVLRGADYFIRDLGSLNGTYIAGRGKLGRDQLYRLKDRDQVVLGGAILQFRRG